MEVTVTLRRSTFAAQGEGLTEVSWEKTGREEMEAAETGDWRLIVEISQ